MKAIVIHKAGDASELVYEDIQVPSVKPHEVLIKLKAAGINFIDVYTRSGLYKPAGYPFIPGKEGSGDIVEVGANVRDFKVGDRVAFCSGGSGSYAEFCTIDAKSVVKIPENVSYENAAAIMLQGLTAFILGKLTFPLKKNDIALIHAGAGGVGLLLIQLAKLLEAKVITTVSSAEKADLAKGAGADYVILYTQQNVADEVLKINSPGVDVVYDSVGKTTFDDSLKSLKTRGMFVAYGQSSGPIAPFSLTRLAEKSLYMTRPVLFHYISTPQELNKLSEELFSLIADGKLKITIGQQYKLADANLAHMDLESRNTIGKSILIVE